MQNFLVVSYNGGEQQWFYDTVRADSAVYAAALICKLRPYVQDAQAMDAAEVSRVAKRVKSAKPKDIAKDMDRIAVASGFQARCQNCEQVYKLDELDDIHRYHERVNPCEETPAGQCPDKACGALCSLIPGAEA